MSKEVESISTNPDIDISKISPALRDKLPHNNPPRRNYSIPQLSSRSAAPPAPRIVKSIPSTTGAARFTWSVVKSELCVGYNIYRALVDNADVSERVDCILQPPDDRRGMLTWEDTVNAVGRYYWVSSVNAGGAESPRIAAKTNFGSSSYGVCPVDLADIGTMVIDASQGRWFRIVIDQDTHFETPINIPCGYRLILELTVSGRGSHNVTWNTDTFKFGSDIPNGDIPQTPNYTHFYGFLWNEHKKKLSCVAFVRDYDLGVPFSTSTGGSTREPPMILEPTIVPFAPMLPATPVIVFL